MGAWIGLDIKDLNVLASNWGKTGRTFSTGDFNYDGRTDALDLGILAANWQKVRPPLAAPVALSVRAPARSATRVIELLSV